MYDPKQNSLATAICFFAYVRKVTQLEPHLKFHNFLWVHKNTTRHLILQWKNTCQTMHSSSWCLWFSVGFSTVKWEHSISTYSVHWWNKHHEKVNEHISIFILLTRFGCYVLNILWGTGLKVENKQLTLCWKNWGARKERAWDMGWRKINVSNVTKCCIVGFHHQGVELKLPLFYFRYIPKFECFFVISPPASYSRKVSMCFSVTFCPKHEAERL